MLMAADKIHGKQVARKILWCVAELLIASSKVDQAENVIEMLLNDRSRTPCGSTKTQRRALASFNSENDQTSLRGRIKIFERDLILDFFSKALMRHGFYYQAINYANSICDAYQRDLTVLKVLSKCFKKGYASRALRIAKRQSRHYGDHNCLMYISRRYCKMGWIEKALEVAKMIPRSHSKAAGQSLCIISQKLVADGFCDQAIEVAKMIDEPIIQGNALRSISVKLVHEGHIDRAIEVAQMIRDALRQGRTFCLIAEVLANIGLTDEALALAMMISDHKDQGRALYAIAEQLVNEGRIDSAIIVADMIERCDTNCQEAWVYDYNSKIYEKILLKLLIDEDIKKAVKVITKASDRVKDSYCFEVCKQLVQANKINRALKIAKLIPNATERKRTRKWIIAQAVERGLFLARLRPLVL
jgi:tetratricopeptide (TPR) repeat protein